jgi:hypothetical protein
MGHVEMCLAVAGLKDDEVNETTRRLAGDWSDFTPAEPAAFNFTRKQAPDVEELERHFGAAGAWQVVWWASRCHYMTRVADAFQLPLERENPFWAMPRPTKH